MSYNFAHIYVYISGVIEVNFLSLLFQSISRKQHANLNSLYDVQDFRQFSTAGNSTVHQSSHYRYPCPESIPSLDFCLKENVP